MRTFADLLRESVVVQGAVTLILVVTISIMYLKGMQVPPVLEHFVALILGFYFGSKVRFWRGEKDG